MKRLLIITISAFVVSCGTGRQNSEPVEIFDRNQFFVVNYEEILEQPAEVKLSEIALDIDYVRLETSDKCLLHTYAEYFFTDNNE